MEHPRAKNEGGVILLPFLKTNGQPEEVTRMIRDIEYLYGYFVGYYKHMNCYRFCIQQDRSRTWIDVHAHCAPVQVYMKRSTKQDKPWKL